MSKDIKDLELEILSEDPSFKNEIEKSTNLIQLPNSGLSEEIEIENISFVTEKKIDWLWKDKIAYGKITLFAGEPGVGKSQLLLYIASILSKGDKFHFENKPCDKSRVLLISGEDNADDTLKPRLLALNANTENIDYVKGILKIDKGGNKYYDVICLIDHLTQLETKIKENKYKLIIIDPITLYLGSIDENKNKEIRAALNVIGALAERNNIAIVLNSHFSKPSGNSQKNAIYRVMGSIGFAAAARIVFGVMKDPEDPERRLFIPIKNNIGQDKEGYVYRIVPSLINGTIETSKIDWLNERIDKTANEILNSGPETKSPKLEEAKDFLLDILKYGSVSLSEITQKATELKISFNRLYKAKNELNISESDSFSRKRGKIWMLPA